MNLLRAAAEAAHFLEARKIPYFIIGGLALQRLNLDLGTVREWLENFRPMVDTHDPLELFEQALRRARRSLEEGDRGKR